MIGKLKGLIDGYGEDYVILDVGGVGYQVHCSGRTLQALPAPGEAVVLSIETYVREDQIRLFGFRTDVEREWFRLLQTVQGVGAKVALAVLGTLPPADLANAIALRDKAAVTRTPGVGPKVAQRIVTELKDNAPAVATVDPALAAHRTPLRASFARLDPARAGRGGTTSLLLVSQHDHALPHRHARAPHRRRRRHRAAPATAVGIRRPGAGARQPFDLHR